jgi:hypothetical protein
MTRSLSWSTTWLGVPRPGSDHQRRPLDLAALLEVGPDDRNEPLRDPVGALGTEPGQRVADLGVREPLDQLVLVCGEVHSGDVVQGGRRLTVHVGQEEVDEEGVLAYLVGVPVPAQVAQVAERLVAGVEQAQLHQLVRLDVGDELDADVLEGRPSCGAALEGVLERPLGERLADHRPRVLDAELVGQGGDVLRCGDRGDPVDHRVGKTNR